MKGITLGRNFKTSNQDKVEIHIEECLMNNGTCEKSDYNRFLENKSKVMLIQANYFEGNKDLFAIDTGAIIAVFKGTYRVL